MRMLPIALLALTVPAAIAVAQMPTAAPGKKDPALVVAGSYAVDPGHTIVRWTVDHFGFSPYFGLFGEITGTLTLDPKNPAAAKVDVTIPVSKVVTTSSALTSHLLRAPKEAGGKPDFFGPGPADARFVSTAVAVTGQNAKITGNLTLNGVTKPVTLDAAFYGAGKFGMGGTPKDNVGFTAKGTIKRSDFGIGFAIPLVSDAVELDITAAFVK